MGYVLTKHKHKWSVYDSNSRCYFYVGCGKKFCERKTQELNNKDI